MPKKYDVSLVDMPVVAGEIVRRVKKGAVVFLYGPLGAGKTTLVREMCVHWEVPEQVSSPSFALINIYQGKDFPIAHIDLYRLSGADDLAQIGVEDYLDGTYVVIVEWPEHGREFFPEPDLQVELALTADGARREISVAAAGEGVHVTGC